MGRNYKGITINTSRNTHETVFDLVDKNYQLKIADIPCGSGAFVQRLKDAGYSHIVAVDIENILEIEHESFLEGDMAKALPLPDRSCNVVICIDGIEHISPRFEFVKEVHRILDAQGDFIISTPNINSLRSRWKWMTTGHHHKCNSPLDEDHPSPLHHVGMISFPEIRYMLHTNGFRITEIRTNRIKPVNWIFSLLLPLVYVSTYLVYRKTGKKQNMQEVNRSVFKSMFSKKLLFGETLVVKARKKESVSA